MDCLSALVEQSQEYSLEQLLEESLLEELSEEYSPALPSFICEGKQADIGCIEVETENIFMLPKIF